MRKIYTSLLVLAMVMVGTTAKAQGSYTVDFSQPYQSDWYNTTYEIQTQQLCDYFGVDKATFVADFNELFEADAANYKQADNSDKTMLLQCVVNGGAEVFPNADQTYSSEPIGFWLDDNGRPLNYGDEGYAWYAFLTLSPTTQDTLLVHVGQLPKHYPDGGKLKANFALNYKDKSATIEFDVTVEPKPASNLAEPTKSYAALEVAKEYTATLEYEQGKEYGDFSVEIDMSDVYDALGVNPTDLDASLQEVLLARTAEKDANDSYSLSDNLVLWPFDEFVDGCDGWFGRYTAYDEASDTETPLEMNAPHSWGTNATFYIHQPTLAAGKFTFLHGQMGGTLKAGDTDKAELYIVNGTKAAKITFTVNVTKRDTAGDPDLSTYTKVGEGSIVETVEEITGGYKEFNITLENAEEIATLLGCSADEAELWFLTAEGATLLTNDPTSVAAGSNASCSHGTAGAWVNEKGVPQSWGSSALIALYYEKLSDGTYSISYMQMPDNSVLEAIKSTTFPIYLVNTAAGTYYQINFTFQIEVPVIEVTQKDWKEKAVYNYDVQLIPSDGYLLDQKTEVDLAAVKSVVGVEDINKLKLYGDVYFENEADYDADNRFTKKLTLTPEGGFWMRSVNGKLYPANYGEADAMGMDWQNSGEGLISWYNKPGTRNPGDAYQGDFYLVDEVTGNYVRLHCNIEFVTEIVELEDKGEETVVIIVSDDNMNGDGYYTASNDLSSACQAMAIDVTEKETLDWYITASSGSLVKEIPELDVTLFDENGRKIDYADGGELPDNYAFSLAYDDVEEAFILSFVAKDVPETVNYTTKMAVRYDNLRYIYNIFIQDKETNETAIRGINAAAKANNVYDMSGRIVRRNANTATGLEKGIYMVNGQKVVVK